MLGVMGDLVDARAERRRPLRLTHVGLQSGHELVHTVELQRRAEVDGEQLALGDHGPQPRQRDAAGLQIFVHRRFIERGNILDIFRVPPLGGLDERHGASGIGTRTTSIGVNTGAGVRGRGRRRQLVDGVGQTTAQIGERRGSIGAGGIHLVDEDEGGYLVSGEQSPQGFGVALHAVGAGDHENRVVEHTQHTFGFGGEVHVAGCVEQREVQIAAAHGCLVGMDGDAALFLQRFGVEEGVAVVHATEFADASGAVQQRFG